VANLDCRECAMPWSRAKALAAEVRACPIRTEKELALFKACFRIQREACEAAGHHIPLIVENVRGTQPWVGRARWMFGSFALWGDVPALMPIASRAVKVPGMGHGWRHPNDPRHIPGLGFNTHADRNLREDIKNTGGSWFNIAHNTTSGKGRNPDGRKGAGGTWFGDYEAMKEGIKCGGDWFNASQPSISRTTSSKSPARKMASAMIAKIPEPLSRHIARTFYPR
jgi:hypothetical protein